MFDGKVKYKTDVIVTSVGNFVKIPTLFQN